MSESTEVYRFDRAIMRRAGKSVTGGLRASGVEDPSYSGVVAEQNAYASALSEAGVNVLLLPALEAFPDSMFVEDPALVFPEGAILLKPGAESRAGEAALLAPALREQFDCVIDLSGDGHVDGGDILTTPNNIMIGLSSRTDRAGAKALQEALMKLGRRSEIVETPAGVLHFKSDCSLLDGETVLTTARLAASGVFKGMQQILTPDGEETAANALRVNDVVFVSAGFPKTMELLRQRGYDVVALPTAEISKIDAGLSCMSLRWRRAKP